MSTIQELAQELLEELRPGCERIEIAGSIRRGELEPKDIELVAIPRITGTIGGSDFFGNLIDADVHNELDELVNDMVRKPLDDQPWHMDSILRRNGLKYKRLRHVDANVCCDLFIVTPETWGAQFAIRTGPADFSHMLVTRALRLGMKQEDGRLWRIHRDDTKTVIETPEERDYFAALGLPWIEPEMRGKVAA